MPSRPEISIVGGGRLGSALAFELKRAGYRIREIVSRPAVSSTRHARALARRVGASAVPINRELGGSVVCLCVPDSAIESTAAELAKHGTWTGKVALHASGARGSHELHALGKAGASVASLHPLMTFVSGSKPRLQGVPFALEGDPKAVRQARKLVRDLGGRVFPVEARRKSAYHAWGAFASPLLIALLVTAEEVARAAGISPRSARRRMLPILNQTLRNYAELGPDHSFSGPLVRGDAETVALHLKELRSKPQARRVYVALAKAALQHLPVQNPKQIARLLENA